MEICKDDDENFLSYVERHSTSPRAAFSKEDVERLLALADVEGILIPVDKGLPGFYNLYSPVAKPLIEAARTRLSVKHAQLTFSEDFMLIKKVTT
jgi:hypothetical protein